MSTQPHKILVEFELHSGMRPRFVELVRSNAAASLRDESGCRRFEVFVPSTGDAVFLYEEYVDAAAFAEHCRSPHFGLFDVAVAPMVASKRVTVLDSPKPLAIPKVKSAVAENLRTLKQILENVRG